MYFSKALASMRKTSSDGVLLMPNYIRCILSAKGKGVHMLLPSMDEKALSLLRIG